MERELWRIVYCEVLAVARRKKLRGATFDDSEIVTTYLWAVLHDRPTSWACRRSSWPFYWRRPLPTPSTMSRRLRKASVQAALAEIERHLRGNAQASLCRWIDAKPLPIGGSSQDRQAGFGRAAGTMAKGYKLHAIADAAQGFIAWKVHPMNTNAQRAAPALVAQLQSEGYLVGDGEYDGNRLYEIAAAQGVQLLAPRRQGTRLGHKRHSVYRLRGVELLECPFGQALLESRDEIDRMFAHLTTPGWGLKPLPGWVRTHFRVALWVRGKMIFYHAWRNAHATTAA
jgi:hypothetical protein